MMGLGKTLEVFARNYHRNFDQSQIPQVHLDTMVLEKIQDEQEDLKPVEKAQSIFLLKSPEDLAIIISKQTNS